MWTIYFHFKTITFSKYVISVLIIFYNYIFIIVFKNLYLKGYFFIINQPNIKDIDIKKYIIFYRLTMEYFLIIVKFIKIYKLFPIER